ncbi:MAG: hypothetical protein KAT91_01005 [Candidatus Aenigmarchaeota archaeon]|nr:hypothetical protein [Candidatus Aenigmarchaeota archaeon]
MVDFSSMMDTMRGSGFDTFVLPWILFLVIIYAIVLKAPFLKSLDGSGQKKQIAVIIAAILSFFIINFRMSDGRLVGEALTTLFGSMSLYIAGILVIILFLGMGNWSIKGEDGSAINSLVVVALVLVAIMIFFNTGMAESFNISDETATWLFMLLLVGGALYFLGKGDGGGE